MFFEIALSQPGTKRPGAAPRNDVRVFCLRRVDGVFRAGMGLFRRVSYRDNIVLIYFVSKYAGSLSECLVLISK